MGLQSIHYRLSLLLLLPRSLSLLQHGSFQWETVLQEWTASAWVPHGVTSCASKPARVWAPLSTSPQVLPGTCSSMGFPWGNSLLWVHLPACVWGPPCDICFTVNLCELQRDSLCYHGLHHGLQQNFCASAWSTSSLSFFADLGVYRVVSAKYSHSYLTAAIAAGSV